MSATPDSPSAEPPFDVIVICGPGGVGKGTVVAELLERDGNLWLSRSWTTRARRPGEAPDAYYFKTPAEFQEHIDRGGFLEWAHFLDYMQGSPLPDPPVGKDVLFEIDVQGAQRIKELFPESLLVFIDAPNRRIQEERMIGRGDSPERIAQRLAKAGEELERAQQMDFVHVINDDLAETVRNILELIDEHRSR